MIKVDLVGLCSRLNLHKHSHHIVFTSWQDVAQGSWWNLGTKAALAKWEKSNMQHYWQTLSQLWLSFISSFWIVISSFCLFLCGRCQEVEYSLNLIDGGKMQGSCYFAFHTCLMFSFLVAHSVFFFFTFWFPYSLYFFGRQKIHMKA